MTHDNCTHQQLGKRTHLTVIILALLLLLDGAYPATAQSGDVWGLPVNVSRSGAASQPLLIAGPGGTARALWWDAFEGLATARYDGETWLSPEFAPLQIVEEVNNTTVIREPSAMPAIFGDVNGTSHAFWLDVPDTETGVQPLMHSRLTANATTWTTPQAVAASAIAWQMTSSANGVLHLAYLRTAHSTALPAGIYYRRSTNGGQTWTPAVPLATTIYFRLVTPETAYLTLAAGATDGVAVAWERPEREAAEYVVSTDGGSSWSEPADVTTPGEMWDTNARAARPRFAFLASGELLRLWEAAPAMMECAIYQQVSRDGGATWSPPEQVLEDLSRCPDTLRLQPLPQGNLLATVQDEGGGLTLTAAEVITQSGSAARIRWAQSKALGFTFEDEANETAIYLDDLDVTLMGAGSVLVAGHDQSDEIWVLQSQQDALSWSFAPPSPWGGPTRVAQRDISAALPAVAIDAEGQIHLLWSEGATPLQYARQTKILTAGGGETLSWSTPTEVLGTAENMPVKPSLVAAKDVLHAVWSEANTGLILYAYAFIDDAYMSSGWSMPQTVGEGRSPALTYTPDGTLHLAFAIPWNEGRGITYARSGGEGQTWTQPPALIFDASAEGWIMVDQPDIAVDAWGGVHVTWTRGGWQDGMLPQGVYYAYSRDGGETWSDPLALAEGTYEASRVAVRQDQIHVIWRDASSEGGSYHRWSSDHGSTWSRAARVAAFENVQSAGELLTDGIESVHLLGLIQDELGAWQLRHARWQAERWESAETLNLGFEYSVQPGLSAVLQPTRGELAALFQSRTADEEGEERTELLAVTRAVSATQLLTPTALAPTPTALTTPQNTPIPTATPRPDISPAQPPSSSQALTLGPLTFPLTAVGGLLIAFIFIGATLLYQLVIARRR